MFFISAFVVITSGPYIIFYTFFYSRIFGSPSVPVQHLFWNNNNICGSLSY